MPRHRLSFNSHHLRGMRPVYCVLLICLSVLLPVVGGAAGEKVRVAVLKYGTVSWEMEIIKHHALDQAAGFTLEPVVLASTQATLVALQAGDVDIAVTDWIWVSRQRASGKPYTFVPYSSAVGALVVPASSDIHSLSDLKGKRLGVGGGPVDKSWLIFRALSLQERGRDLLEEVTPLHAAPPLLNQQLIQGRLDAVINFWPYVARLEAMGMRKLLGVEQAARKLGIAHSVPLVGYVFDQHWARRNHAALDGFITAVSKAKDLMKTSDEAWLPLRPLMRVPDDATFVALRQGFRSGIPAHWGGREREDAAKLFALLGKLGGSRLVGESGTLSEGTFWPDVNY
ncbi:MAG: ABC transporter substrate-binding protein [Gammaproteobacteria bacterium]|nr:ABC transporter substrate-binding protein [Gammaproteobacteria bacterium]